MTDTVDLLQILPTRTKNVATPKRSTHHRPTKHKPRQNRRSLRIETRSRSTADTRRLRTTRPTRQRHPLRERFCQDKSPQPQHPPMGSLEMSYLDKATLMTLASITGLGFYTFSTLLGNGPTTNYIISLIATSGTSMALIEYEIINKRYKQDG